jgi:hypothetical protein
MTSKEPVGTAPGGLRDIQRQAGPRWTPPGSDWTLGSHGFGWVLWVPEGDNTSVQVRSEDQQPPVPSCTDGTVAWVWHGIVAETGRQLDITVTMTLGWNEDGLSCDLAIDNLSAAGVASAAFPRIRGISIPQGRQLNALTRDYYGARRWRLWPQFDWNKGYYGTLRPTLLTDSLVFGNPAAPFAVMLDGTEAVAAATAGPSPEITAWMWELDPGYADTIGDHAATGRQHAELRFSAVHLLDLPAGQRRQLTTVTLSRAAGGWQEALEPYRRQRARIAASAEAHETPDWAARPHSWYQVQLNSAAGERRYTFDDLPALAQDCAAADVTVLHLIGWNDGGQDRNNPSHDPDPALGGAAGLAAGISACHELGVNVALFAKFTWADQATQRFRHELHRSAVRDPYGDYYRNGGYQYLTPHQLLDVSTRRLIPMCFLHEDYLRVCEAEFDKIVASGADAMLFDEAMHHTPALLCYAVDHGHRPGASIYANDAVLARRLRERLPASRRDFVFAGETLYEDLQPSYHMSYIRSHFADHVPLTRFVNPGLRMLTTVSGFDDRNQLNQGLLYGYLYVYEPGHFKGRLGDFPATVEYGRAADQLRRELAEYLWDGTYLGDVRLAGGTELSHATATWRSAAGTSLHLIANYDLHTPASVTLGTPVTEQRTVETGWQPCAATVSVPPRSLVVLR